MTTIFWRGNLRKRKKREANHSLKGICDTVVLLFFFLPFSFLCCLLLYIVLQLSAHRLVNGVSVKTTKIRGQDVVLGDPNRSGARSLL
jgi:hypothetical protein